MIAEANLKLEYRAKLEKLSASVDAQIAEHHAHSLRRAQTDLLLQTDDIDHVDFELEVLGELFDASRADRVRQFRA